jgi:hypothetical protein
MFTKMAKVSYSLVLILFVSLCPLACTRGGTPRRIIKIRTKGRRRRKALQNVAGCLRKDAKAGEGLITAEDGKTWELRSGDGKPLRSRWPGDWRFACTA